MTDRATLRLAHRGDFRIHPENSLEAILAATEVAGCDGVEFDVRASRDGIPVVIHDTTLDRVQGRPDAVADLDAATLEPLGIPALADVLARLPRGAFLDIELKESFGRSLMEVLAAGRGPDLHGAVISSFDRGALARIHGLVPGWPLWLAAHDLSAETISAAVALGCRGLSIERGAIDASSVESAAAAGLEVAAWTIVDPHEARRLAELGLVALCVEGDALTDEGSPAPTDDEAGS